MKEKKGRQLTELLFCIAVIVIAAGYGRISGEFKTISEMISINIDARQVLSLIIMVFFVLAVQKVLILVLQRVKSNRHRSATVSTIAQSIVRYGSALLIFCWGLSILNVDVSTIAASVGIIALIVGFGAESLIEDVITGLFMLFENQYNVGDIVEVGGFRGTVTDIGIRTTSITDAGGNVKIINNSNMKDILNRSDNSSRAVSDIQIPYETDLEQFEKQLPEILEAIYESHKDMMNAVPRYLGVSQLGDSGVSLRFVAEVNEKDIYAAQRLLNRDLLVMFKKYNVEVPYPQVDVHNK